MINTSNLRLAHPSSDLSAIISVGGGQTTGSTTAKAKVAMYSKDFEKLFSQNGEESSMTQPIKAIKQNGMMFMKNGRYCAHHDTSMCDPSCFDYLAQVNKL